jgi:hypothetical protein
VEPFLVSPDAGGVGDFQSFHIVDLIRQLVRHTL